MPTPIKTLRVGCWRARGDSRSERNDCRGAATAGQNPAYRLASISTEDAAERSGVLLREQRSSIRSSSRAAIADLSRQAKRHHEAEIRAGSRPAFRLERRRALGGLERELHLVGRDVPQDLEQVGRVEADVERIAGVRTGDLVRGLAEVRRLDAEAQQCRR